VRERWLGNPERGMTDKRNTIILLRWVLIIASSYLLLFGPAGPNVDPARALFVALVLSSNLVLNHLPDHWFELRAFDMGLVLFDTIWVTISLSWSPRSSDDFFMLYFLVLFVAALGESLPTIVASASVITLVYGWGLNHADNARAMSSETLLRMLFLFVVALFYGYFVTALRGRRREAAEARALEGAKTELLASISHDLRVPLSNAENYAMLLLTGDYGAIGDRPREFIARLQANLRRLSAIVTNCLDATRIEEGRLHLQPNPLQLNDVVNDAVQLESNQAAAKRVALRTDLTSDLPLIVADMMHLSRVVVNLVGNAIKYTPSGGIVTIETRSGDGGVYLDVSDTGPGIALDEQRVIFEKYERLPGGRRLPGTGLGLFIVKSIVAAHHGTVTVKSRSGHGATFTVWLPITAPSVAGISRAGTRPASADLAVASAA
jgi:signal transduction histidine kinase